MWKGASLQLGVRHLSGGREIPGGLGVVLWRPCGLGMAAPLHARQPRYRHLLQPAVFARISVTAWPRWPGVVSSSADAPADPSVWGCLLLDDRARHGSTQSSVHDIDDRDGATQIRTLRRRRGPAPVECADHTRGTPHADAQLRSQAGRGGALITWRSMYHVINALQYGRPYNEAVCRRYETTPLIPYNYCSTDVTSTQECLFFCFSPRVRCEGQGTTPRAPCSNEERHHSHARPGANTPISCCCCCCSCCLNLARKQVLGAAAA